MSKEPTPMQISEALKLIEDLLNTSFQEGVDPLDEILPEGKPISSKGVTIKSLKLVGKEKEDTPYPDPHDVRVQKAAKWLCAVANERMAMSESQGRYIEGILIMLAADILQRGELKREGNPILGVAKKWFAKGCPFT